jgi:hypothetical protein
MLGLSGLDDEESVILISTVIDPSEKDWLAVLEAHGLEPQTPLDHADWDYAEADGFYAWLFHRPASA